MRFLKMSLMALPFLLLMPLASRAQVKINEVMYDDYGTDDSAYVEIYGPGGTPLSGYQLVGVNGFSGAEYQAIDLTGSMPGDGFFVIGQVQFPNVDLVNSNVNYQNGPDNILLKHNGTVVDAIGYGEFVPPDTFFVGEGSPCANQDPGSSLCRYPDGYDTNNNANDFTISPFPTPGTANVLGGEAPFYSLIELRTSPPPPNQIFWTTGIATVDAGLFNGPSNISAYMQDDLAGINVYGGAFTFVAGDCLWVKARLSEYNGLLELYYPLELNVGINVGVPDPLEIDCSIANEQGEALESMLVWLRSVWITRESAPWPNEGLDGNLTITDNTAETVVMRIDKDTDLDGWADHPDVEELFDLVGILNQYNVYQILPRGQSDILPPTAVLPGQSAEMPNTFRLDNPHPNPFNPATTVRFSLARPGWVQLLVFAIDGSHVATLAEGNYASGDHEITWDVARLPSGLYLLRLSTVAGTWAAKALLLR